jgi:hypothetical protein
MKRIGLWAQHAGHYSSTGATSIETYHCPLQGRYKCPCQIRVVKGPTAVQLECSGGGHTQERCHTSDSSRFLTLHQRVTMAKMIKSNPALTGTEVRRIASRGSPNSKIKPSHIRSVSAAVKSSKRDTLAALTGGVPVTDAYSSIAALGDRLWFRDIIRKHNTLLLSRTGKRGYDQTGDRADAPGQVSRWRPEAAPPARLLGSPSKPPGPARASRGRRARTGAGRAAAPAARRPGPVHSNIGRPNFHANMLSA